MTHTEIMQRLADMARAAYVAERYAYDYAQTGQPGRWGDRLIPRWDGGEDDFGKEWTSVWPKIAACAMSAGVDVATLIRARFTRAAGRAPDPSECHGPKAVRTFDGVAVRSEDWVRGELAAGRAVYSREMTRYASDDPRAAAIAVANSPTADLTPLFRYALARRLNLTDLADSILSAAVRQYASARETYDRVWGDIVHEDVRGPYEALKQVASAAGG